MQAHPRLLHTSADIQKLAQNLNTQPMIALDTEFIRENTFYPLLALIQIATEKESWLIDPLALTPEELKPLFEVLSSPHVLKLLHAAQGDQECFYVNYKFVLKPTLDTAVAASLCGYGEAIGLSKLVHEVLNVTLQKGHARTDWTVRPLPKELIHYAHADVQYLIPVWQKLLQELSNRGRKNWAFDLSRNFEDKKLYECNPHTIAERLARGGKLDKRSYAILRELVGWRETQAKYLNVPRRRIVDDGVLMDLAKARPKNIEHLSTFRGLSRRSLKQCGEHLIKIILKAQAIPEEKLPSIPQSRHFSSKEQHAIELLNSFLKVLAHELHISPRYLIKSEALPMIFSERFASPKDLLTHGVLSQGVYELIGEDFFSFLQGKRFLFWKDGVVQCIKSDLHHANPPGIKSDLHSNLSHSHPGNTLDANPPVCKGEIKHDSS